MNDEKALPPAKRPKRDIVLAFVKSALSTSPATGWLVPLIDEALSRSTERSTERAMEFLRERLEQLEDKIDHNAVNQDRLSDAFKSFYRSVTYSSHEEKLRAAANLFADLLIKDGDPEKLGYEEHQHFSHCLDALSIGAIKMLALAYQMTRGRSVRKSQIGEYTFQARDLVDKALGLSPPLVMSLVAELSAWRLMRCIEPGVIMPGDGYGQNETVRLTPMGERFVEYVLRSKEQAPG